MRDSGVGEKITDHPVEGVLVLDHDPVAALAKKMGAHSRQSLHQVEAGLDRDVNVIEPVDEEHAAVLAFLADGESWSSSALALALRTSQRTVQRALDALAAAGKVQSFGRGRARRWTSAPVPGFTTTLLLPAPLPTD